MHILSNISFTSSIVIPPFVVVVVVCPPGLSPMNSPATFPQITAKSKPFELIFQFLILLLASECLSKFNAEQMTSDSAPSFKLYAARSLSNCFYVESKERERDFVKTAKRASKTRATHKERERERERYKKAKDKKSVVVVVVVVVVT